MIADYIANLPMKIMGGIISFFSFWYVRSSKAFWNKEILFIKGIERDIGVLINLKLVFQPIFGDYSYMGRVIGPIFRLGRVFVGLFIVLVSIIIVLVIYLIWILLPPVTFLMIFLNLVEAF